MLSRDWTYKLLVDTYPYGYMYTPTYYSQAPVLATQDTGNGIYKVTLGMPSGTPPAITSLPVEYTIDVNNSRIVAITLNTGSEKLSIQRISDHDVVTVTRNTGESYTYTVFYDSSTGMRIRENGTDTSSSGKTTWSLVFDAEGKYPVRYFCNTDYTAVNNVYKTTGVTIQYGAAGTILSCERIETSKEYSTSGNILKETLLKTVHNDLTIRTYYYYKISEYDTNGKPARVSEIRDTYWEGNGKLKTRYSHSIQYDSVLVGNAVVAQTTEINTNYTYDETGRVKYRTETTAVVTDKNIAIKNSYRSDSYAGDTLIGSYYYTNEKYYNGSNKLFTLSTESTDALGMKSCYTEQKIYKSDESGMLVRHTIHSQTINKTGITVYDRYMATSYGDNGQITSSSDFRIEHWDTGRMKASYSRTVSYGTVTVNNTVINQTAESINSCLCDEAGAFINRSTLNMTTTADGIVISNAYENVSYNSAGKTIALYQYINEKYYTGVDKSIALYTITTDTLGRQTYYTKTKSYNASGQVIYQKMERTVRTAANVPIERYYHYESLNDAGVVTYQTDESYVFWESGKNKATTILRRTVDSNTNDTNITNQYTDYDESARITKESMYTKTTRGNGTMSECTTRKSYKAGIQTEYFSSGISYNANGAMTSLVETYNTWWDDGKRKTEWMHLASVNTANQKTETYRKAFYNESGVMTSLTETTKHYDAQGVLIDSFDLKSVYASGKLTSRTADIEAPKSNDGKYHVVYDVDTAGNVTRTHVYNSAGKEDGKLGGTGYIYPSTIITKIISTVGQAALVTTQVTFIDASYGADQRMALQEEQAKAAQPQLKGNFTVAPRLADRQDEEARRIGVNLP